MLSLHTNNHARPAPPPVAARRRRWCVRRPTTLTQHDGERARARVVGSEQQSRASAMGGKLSLPLHALILLPPPSHQHPALAALRTALAALGSCLDRQAGGGAAGGAGPSNATDAARRAGADPSLTAAVAACAAALHQAAVDGEVVVQVRRDGDKERERERAREASGPRAALVFFFFISKPRPLFSSSSSPARPPCAARPAPPCAPTSPES